MKSLDEGRESVRFRIKSLVVLLDEDDEDHLEATSGLTCTVVPLGGSYTATLPKDALLQVHLVD